MSQREIGDIPLGVGRQVRLQRGDGLGISSGVQVSLADQELGISRDRAGRPLGQLGENGIGQGRLPQGPVSQGQLVAGGLGQGGRWRAAPAFSRRRRGGRRSDLRIATASSCFPCQRGGAGLDQPNLRLERALGKPGRESHRPGAEPPPDRPGRGPSGRPAACASSAQGSLGSVSTTRSNRAWASARRFCFCSTSADPKLHGRRQRRLRKPLQSPTSSVVKAASGWLRSSSIVASSKRGPRALGSGGIGRQRSQERFGLARSARVEPRPGAC